MLIMLIPFFNLNSPNGKSISSSINEAMGNKPNYQSWEQNLKISNNGTELIALSVVRDILYGE